VEDADLRLQGNIASFNPSKHFLSIMFHRGAEIPGQHPRLEGDGRLVRTMRFADLEQLEAGSADLEAVIRASGRPSAAPAHRQGTRRGWKLLRGPIPTGMLNLTTWSP
jgi:hypothetical protein